jgi:hypothetical protein
VVTTIGWLVIGTNRYRDLALRCLKSISVNYRGALSSRFFFVYRPAADFSARLGGSYPGAA